MDAVYVHSLYYQNKQAFFQFLIHASLLVCSVPLLTACWIMLHVSLIRLSCNQIRGGPPNTIYDEQVVKGWVADKVLWRGQTHHIQDRVIALQWATMHQWVNANQTTDS